MVEKKKKTRSTSSSVDPATRYAMDVESGREIAGPDIRNSCKRHLKDLDSCHARGLHWDASAAQRAIDFDQYRIKYLEPELEEAAVSVPLIPHGQGYYKAQESGLWMPHSIELFEQRLDDGEIIIKTNPCLRWNAASAVTEADQKENRIFAKKKSTGRIDGVVASAMAIGASEGDVTDDGDIDDFFSQPLSM